MGSLVSFRLGQNLHLPFGRGSTATADVRDIWRLRDGGTVTLRAAEAGDGSLMQELVRGLSLQSRYQRFFYPLHELTPDLLARFVQHDPAQAMTLLAFTWQNGRDRVVAMAQYVADPYPQRCDFAVVVADEWQGRGLGRQLIQALICIARAAGIEHIDGDVLAENAPMLGLLADMGFMLAAHEEGPYLRKATKALGVPEWKCSPLVQLAAGKSGLQGGASRWK